MVAARFKLSVSAFHYAKSWDDAHQDASKLLGALWALRFALESRAAEEMLGNQHGAKRWLKTAGFSIPWTDELLDAMLGYEEDSEARSKAGRKRRAIVNWDEAAAPFADYFPHHRTQLHRLFRFALERVEKAWGRVNASDPVWRNTAMLADLLRLTDLERNILLFAAMAAISAPIKKFLSCIEFESNSKAYGELAILLDAKPQDLITALRQDRPLLRMGLLERWDDRVDAVYELAKLTRRLAGLMDYSHENLPALMRAFMEETAPGCLGTDDFPHMDTELELLGRVLRQAVQSREKGVNVLFYGPPGTGKTEFVKLLAQRAKARLYEVSCTDDEGDSASAMERYTSYSLIQRFLAQRDDSLVLFDEVEDVLQPDGTAVFALLFGTRSSQSFSKAWVNQQLEDNPVPTVWVCNSIDYVDPAHLRRFVYHIEFRTPPRSVRQRVASKYLKSLPVPESVPRRLAEYAALSPAQMESAARLLKLNASDSPEENERLVLTAVKNSMAALGQERQAATGLPATPYRLDYLNVDATLPLEKIVRALQARPRSSLCLYGPPGTGKTQLARFIADQLDRPLLAKRASDLLSKWVGESEKNIAAMFQEAMDENAVLLLDEADSFLRERAGLENSWQVSQVNELLQQMERFEGIFLCATNLFEHIDQAALRRFTFKIRFDYLKPEQRWRLFAETLELSANEGEAKLRGALDRLDKLAPGDFANVCKQAIVLEEKLSPEEFLARLEAECALKDGGRGRHGIGFV